MFPKAMLWGIFSFRGSNKYAELNLYAETTIVLRKGLDGD